jgi:lysylphosphatidylglycerol synthetase-like protein (DUF2156 family)
MNEAKLRSQSLGLLSMLGLQFILGMILNLFIKLPKGSNSLTTTIKHGGGLVLVLHILVAIGLLIGSLILVARSYAAKSRSWIIASIVGTLGVIAALTNGLAFIGNSNDVNSFVMAIGFMVAATAYSVTLSFNAYPVNVAQPKEVKKSKRISGSYRHSHS